MSFFAITSDKPRHIKFIKTLQNLVDLSCVVVVPKDNSDKQFTEEELRFFTGCNSLSYIEHVKCDKDNLESDYIINLLTQTRPEVGFIFGAPLISKRIYDIPKLGCVNIHTGLVQYYRGVDSSSWALYDNRLDRIGTTLHYIDDSIDAGRYIGQKTIDIRLDDTPNSIFFKTCQAGFDLISENISDIIENICDSKHLTKRGTLYQVKDMKPEIKKEIYNSYKLKIKEFLDENYSRSM